MMRDHVASTLWFALLLQVAPVYAQYQNYGYQANTGGFGTAGNTSFSGGFSNFAQAQSVPQQRRPSAAPHQNYQNTTMNDLESRLDSVDNQNAWANTPVSGVQNVPQQQMSYPQQHMSRPSNVGRTLPVPRPGSAANAAAGMFPGVSRQEMLRVFIEGGMPDNSANQGYRGYNPAPQNSSNSQGAYYDYQTAENEATKSRNYANTARYDKNKWNRKNAASQAEYAANNADYAARRAESKSYNGDAKAKNYASLARQAANRARYNANQARYNANTIN